MAPEGAWSVQSMQAMTANMQGLKAAADSGSFAISKAGAEAYVNAIQKAQDELVSLEMDLVYLRQETKLGTSPDGQRMAQYNMDGALGGPGTTGIVPAIEQLKTALEEARLAMVKAVENYGQVDDDSADGLRRY
ncbi:MULTISPECIES: hypothetical protein [Saccharothrix]|uniref:PE family protein n=1 Tax=Saccharothrix yanglingensis TaxID=659496 RepID=A0ABU0WSF7_9PSEU|nr:MULTISPECIES: hypothetical protein [Saccharothrix]MDQ2582781.1 hypothetical protein [Saccharothrix yanglingensis]MDU0291198.1 hypothetical protein [Saccharothrix longispora]